MNPAIFAIPFLIGLVYLAIFVLIIYFVYQWVTKIIKLKEEQNQILRQILQKLEKQ
jgi:D-alanyl-lipoteichoic acid acyltransferase DltB (MBOAT superfamily)